MQALHWDASWDRPAGSCSGPSIVRMASANCDDPSDDRTVHGPVALASTALTEATPNHSTLSRTRRLIDVETHVAVFTWVLERLAESGLVKGKTEAAE